MPRIWGRISSINVRKVVLCAQALGLDVERSDAGQSFGVEDTPDYRAQNPSGQVPLLQGGDFALWESDFIVRRLCKRESSSLYPIDLRTQFGAERWMDWQQTTLNRASGNAFVQSIRTPAEQRSAPAIAQSVAATEPLFDLLNRHLSRQPFMCGDTLSMADIPVACEVHRWWGLPQPRPAWRHVEARYARWLAHPASRGVLDLELS